MTGVIPVVYTTSSTNTPGAGATSSVSVTNTASYPVRFTIEAQGTIEISNGDLTVATFEVASRASVNAGRITQNREMIGWSSTFLGYLLRAAPVHVTNVVQPGQSAILTAGIIPSISASQDGVNDSTVTFSVFGRYTSVRA